jgi:hypothetical protein
MKFFTSIAPRHYHENRQYECVATWLKYGEVYSINCKAEIEVLKDVYPFVNFIETTETAHEQFGKPYVRLNAMLYNIKQFGGGVLINSDIELTAEEGKFQQCIDIFKNKPKEFLHLHRYNYDKSKYTSLMYKDGVDVFFLRPEHLEHLPKTEYCIGHCYFDIWIPFWLKMNGFNLTTIQQPIAFHKNHPVQYKAEHWDYFGQYTGKNFLGSKQQSGKITDRIYRFNRGNTVYL